MDSAIHQKIGRAHFLSAWTSLLLVAGIIGFMVTGHWRPSKVSGWGIFGTEFLVLRCFSAPASAILLAGCYGYLTASFTRDDRVRRR